MSMYYELYDRFNLSVTHQKESWEHKIQLSIVKQKMCSADHESVDFIVCRWRFWLMGHSSVVLCCYISFCAISIFI